MRTMLEIMLERDRSAAKAALEETRPSELEDAAFHRGAAHALDWALGKNSTREPSLAPPSSVGAPR